MPAVAIVGAQWGDEGKGKLVDVLSAKADFVVRWQGGANAGHSLKVGDRELILHLLPSAVLRRRASCFIGPGTVLDLDLLCREIQTLKQYGYLSRKDQLLVSDQACLVLPCHKALDKAREKRAKKAKIGTTCQGIGPAYESRISRKALLFADIFESDRVLTAKLQRAVEESNFLLSQFYGEAPVSLEKSLESLKTAREFLRPFRSRSIPFLLQEALRYDKNILFEGAQGLLLDMFHGAYPFVTGSSTLSASALSSCGLGLSQEEGLKTLAVAKAYSTRVGAGPFPSELRPDSPMGQRLFERGQEFGATTGRKRRCGWLDLTALQYSLRLTGAKHLALTKLDVLSGVKELQICVSYFKQDLAYREFPPLCRDLLKVRPVLRSFEGWSEDLSKIKYWRQLPPAAKYYVEFIAKELDVEISAVSVGPEREQILGLKPLFKKNKPREDSNYLWF